ncbi:hypothetical protein V1L54_05585 [Streptomyces sp. TRM 70361]|uniref:hypothetical protein n=1 Tax=Streptomyces sp. TRM 70361 TaxID=3116553 RepID=UPI002E7B0D2A|nr:hypothetical protein [Streptomyces sp. TRM 70361]MEE1938889.1 hypothetical protein [Streptomyces sp. TRM 70361]
MVVRKGALAALAVCVLAAGLAGCTGGGGAAEPGGLPLGLDGTAPADPPAEGGVPGTGGDPGGTELSDRPAAEIAERMSEAMEDLTSLRMSGRLTVDGEMMELDVTLTKVGLCSGSMTVDGGTAEVVRTEKRMYMKGDERFWESQGDGTPEDGAVVDLLKDRWVKVPPEEADAEFGAICDLDRMLESLDDPGADSVTKGAVTEIGGRQAIPLVERRDGETTTGYVADDEAEPYLLRVESADGDEPGVIDLTGHNEDVEITEPPASEVIDPEEFGGPGISEDV